jgi:formylglycine-generating enzyme required for sulfatase activity
VNPLLAGVVIVCDVVAFASCQSQTHRTSETRLDGNAAPSTGNASRRVPRESLAAERAEIPGGKFLAGSVPGSEGRQPQWEPAQYEVELGPFQIDRLPFPNDPKAAPLVSVTQAEAERHCAERGARLCTELEWERACKGPQSDAYAGGPQWSEQCAQEPTQCASGFDVLAMGAAIREWTISEVAPTDSYGPTDSADSSRSKKRAVAVRGAAPSSPGPEHRCARREPVDPETRSTDLGFRCCGGAPNGAVVREPALERAFVKFPLTAERLQRLLRSDRRTASLATDVKLFREPDAAETVVARGPGDRQGFDFTVSPLVWNPAAGARYLLVSGRSGDKTSYVLAYYVVGGDDYRLLASFVMLDEPGPVAFAYSSSIRPRLHFSTCWGCPGETGKILYRPPDSVAVLQP